MRAGFGPATVGESTSSKGGLWMTDGANGHCNRGGRTNHSSAAMVDGTPSADESGPLASTPSGGEASRLRPRVKSTACNTCHARKVRCSGGQPCLNCRQAGKQAECFYPRRNRLVKVSQRYLDDLVAENQRLKASCEKGSSNSSNSGTEGRPGHTCEEHHGSSTADDPAAAGAVPDAFSDQRPWFFDMNVPHTPILINEAADAAFATRFRQAVSGCGRQRHLPRVNFATDETLHALSGGACNWPSPSRARVLVNVALRYVSRFHHVVRRSAILEGLEQFLEQSLRRPGCRSGDSFLRSKLWALFALGELYSTRSIAGTGGRYPGLAYFAQALRALDVVNERPRIDSSFYSLAINRRHSAHILAGTAVRVAVLMGLHLNVPESHLSDVGAREHRCRVWWTAYIFDRMWASKLGIPAAVDDLDIQVDLPSDAPAQQLKGTASAEDFADAAYVIARVKLARLACRLVQSIYGRRTQQESLSKRVQQALRDLMAWADDLPPHLHIDARGSGKSELVPRPTSLHLFFNQCVITVTRPILLHVLRSHVASWPPSLQTEPRPQPHPQAPPPSDPPTPPIPIPNMAMTVAETCVRCARHSVRLLLEAWIDGSFATFHYIYTQYLFSAATALAISSLLPTDGRDDRAADGEQFEAASAILAELGVSGSYAAGEFCQHIDAIKLAMEEARARRSGGREGDPLVGNSGGGGVFTPTLGPRRFPSVDAGAHSFLGPVPSTTEFHHETSGRAQFGSTSRVLEAVGSAGVHDQPFTAIPEGHDTTTADLAVPSLQELLAQPALDLQFIDASIYNHGSYSQGLYWPDVTPDTSNTWDPDSWTAS